MPGLAMALVFSDKSSEAPLFVDLCLTGVGFKASIAARFAKTAGGVVFFTLRLLDVDLALGGGVAGLSKGMSVSSSSRLGGLLSTPSECAALALRRSTDFI